MNARAWITGSVMLVLLGGSPMPAAGAGADGPLIKPLRDLIAGNIAAYNRKDVSGVLATIDTKSPDYDPTKAALTEQFQDLDAKAELVDFQYVGHDDSEFAVARVKIKTTAPPGKGFTNNTVDAMMIFHQENGAWKLWDETILGVDIAQ